MTISDKAWGVVKDRDLLFDDELRLPGADTFVGPKVGDLPYPDFEDPYDEENNPYAEALAHAQDMERNRILAEGMPDPRQGSPENKTTEPKRRPFRKPDDWGDKRDRPVPPSNPFEKAWGVVKGLEPVEERTEKKVDELLSRKKCECGEKCKC